MRPPRDLNSRFLARQEEKQGAKVEEEKQKKLEEEEARIAVSVSDDDIMGIDPFIPHCMQ